MRNIRLLTGLLLIISSSVFAQSLNHTVKKGENIYRISIKYGVSMQSIFNANPGSEKMIRVGQVLKIPGVADTKANIANSYSSGSYTVKKGDTKYALSKKFGVSIAELEQYNPEIRNGLQSGQRITIKSADKKQPQSTTKSNNGGIKHEIERGQTLWSISKAYDMEVEDILAANPGLDINNLQAGQMIDIPEPSKKRSSLAASSVPPSIATTVETPKPNPAETETEPIDSTTSPVVSEDTATTKQPTTDQNEPITEEVEQNNITPEEPTIKASPLDNSDKDNIPTSGTKQVIWLLPDSFETITKNEDKSTLDYFRGGHIALNELKSDGLLIEETIINVNSKSRKALNESIQSADLVISLGGKTNQLNQVKVPSEASILNLSTEDVSSKNFNLNPIANFESQSEALLEHIKTLDGNLIVINDNSRKTDANIIKSNAPNAGFVETKANGTFNESDLVALLIARKLNVVLINSDKTSVYLNATNALLRQYASYDIQLAVLNPELIPNGSQISDKRFRILGLMFPSMIALDGLTANDKFAKSYQLEHGTAPGNEAFSGYDASHDAILRLFNKQGFKASLDGNSGKKNYLNINYQKDGSNSVANRNIYLYKYHPESGFEQIKN